MSAARDRLSTGAPMSGLWAVERQWLSDLRAAAHGDLRHCRVRRTRSHGSWAGERRLAHPLSRSSDARARPRVSAAPRREAALVGRRRGPGQRALLATGVSLFVAGTAAAIYLSLSGKAETRRSLSATAGVLPPRLTISRPPDAARLPANPRPRTRPATNPVRQPVKTFHPERPVAAGVRYEARAFPIAIRITPPDGTWGGAQWTNGELEWTACVRLGSTRPAPDKRPAGGDHDRDRVRSDAFRRRDPRTNSFGGT